MSSDFYFRFNLFDTINDKFACITVSNLTDREVDTQLWRVRAGSTIVAEPIVPSAALHTDLRAFGDIEPLVLFDIPLSRLSLRPGLNALEIVGEDMHPVAETARFAVPFQIDIPLPNEENIKRVAGKMRPQGFEYTGACWYSALKGLREFAQFNSRKDINVLDWGVGCGRVARYFIMDGYQSLTGVDIDSLNIQWCIDNLRNGSFLRTDFDPPLPFSDNSFDLVYGHSVFTHLGYDSEVAWLKELNRVLSPSGFALVTFGSEFTSHLNFHTLQKKNPDFLKQLSETGRQDFGADGAGVDTGRDGYYRLVAHTRDYVQRNWSNAVDLVRIIPGFAIAQDAVVFRKRNR